jgi:hypothetical protein
MGEEIGARASLAYGPRLRVCAEGVFLLEARQ